MGQREGLRLIYPESQALMLRYGAVLLHGSDVRSHEDFAAVSHSLNCGTPAPRSYCFFCELASSVGGAVPMNSSAEVADVVARLCSGFSQKLVELCVRYVRVMPEVTIDGSALGWSWEVTYNAATMEEAEAAMHKQGTSYWWLPDGYSRRDQSRSSGRTETSSQDTFVPIRRVLAISRGPPLRTSVRRHACPTPSAVSVHPALRVGISGAEMIGQEHIRNVPVFREVLSGCHCLATRLERVLGRQARHGDSDLQLEHTNVYYNATCVRSSHSPCCSHGLGTRYQRHRLRLDVVGYQAEGSDRRQSFSCATLPAAWLEIFWSLNTALTYVRTLS